MNCGARRNRTDEGRGVIKLSKQTLATLESRCKPYIAYDTELTVFGVAIYPSGIKRGSVSANRTRAGMA